jgi:hypothetical protein
MDLAAYATLLTKGIDLADTAIKALVQHKAECLAQLDAVHAEQLKINREGSVPPPALPLIPPKG